MYIHWKGRHGMAPNFLRDFENGPKSATFPTGPTRKTEVWGHTSYQNSGTYEK